jgi:endothelin-converting enzyme/putative endopeptidase
MLSRRIPDRASRLIILHARPRRPGFLRHCALAACIATASALCTPRTHRRDRHGKGRRGLHDFFDYANGAWRRVIRFRTTWIVDRRWESGEINKEHVRDILTELSARKDWSSGSPEQLSGDFYAACMDETQVDTLGIAGAAAARRSARDQEQGRCATHGRKIARCRRRRAIRLAASRICDPTQIVANIVAGGLGMPTATT